MLESSARSVTSPQTPPQPSPEARTDAEPEPRTVSTGASDVRLFRHCKRTHWGVAALLWERDGKRGYQFSDGKMRVFKEGFYHLFESAVAPGDGSAKAVRRLARLARADDVTEATRLPTLRDQILLFRRNFPDGFTGEDWQKKHRGVGARKRLKRHRSPAIRDAHQLSAEQLAPVIEGRDWPAVLERLIEVASCSNLVPSSHVKRLKKLEPSRELSTALYEWVRTVEEQPEPPEVEVEAGAEGQGEGNELDRRFNYLARLLGPAGTWPVVTSLRGLIDPEHHTCVRPSVFSVQAKMLLPNFAADKRPRYVAYQRYLHVAKTVHDELDNAGLAPRDLLDVYDFIWETLRPAVRDELTHQYELPPPETAEQPEAASEAQHHSQAA